MKKSILFFMAAAATATDAGAVKMCIQNIGQMTLPSRAANTDIAANWEWAVGEGCVNSDTGTQATLCAKRYASGISGCSNTTSGSVFGEKKDSINGLIMEVWEVSGDFVSVIAHYGYCWCRTTWPFLSKWAFMRKGDATGWCWNCPIWCSDNAKGMGILDPTGS